MARTTTADVVIVGSGPVGSTFARTISDLSPGLSIVMVEAGPQITDPPGRHVKTITDPAELNAAQIASQGPTQYDYGRGRAPLTMAVGGGELTARPGTFLVANGTPSPGAAEMPAAAMACNVGGMGAHWTCAAPIPGGGERIEFIPRADFDELFAEAWRLLSVTQNGFVDAPLGEELRHILAAAFDEDRPADRRVQPMPLGINVGPDGERYWTGPDVILGDIATRGAFTLVADTLVTRVLTNGSHATGVRVLDRRSTEEYDISAGAVIVAADSFRTPQLLFASGIRPRALGHYLNDHSQALALARLSDDFIPDSARVARQPGTVDPLSGVTWIPYDRDRMPFHVQVMQMDASPIPLERIEEPWPGSIVGLGTFGCKDLRFDDRVEFSDDEVDSFGMPALTIHYALTARDRQTFDDMVTALERIASVVGELVGGPPIALPLGSSLHYMGTVRMGAADDGESVCDSNSRVWGYDNLFVGGNGVIPTPTACNPTATSVALAIRSARALVSELTTRDAYRT